jgi:hypothetical protein
VPLIFRTNSSNSNEIVIRPVPARPVLASRGNAVAGPSHSNSMSWCEKSIKSQPLSSASGERGAPVQFLLSSARAQAPPELSRKCVGFRGRSIVGQRQDGLSGACASCKPGMSASFLVELQPRFGPPLPSCSIPGHGRYDLAQLLRDP